MEIILRQIEWSKKRNALDMIPMIVRDENVGLQRAVAFGIRPMIAEHAQAGPAIEHESRAVGRRHIQARRVSAIAPHSAIQSRNRAAYSPEDQFGDIPVHRKGSSSDGTAREEPHPQLQCGKLRSISS